MVNNLLCVRQLAQDILFDLDSISLNEQLGNFTEDSPERSKHRLKNIISAIFTISEAEEEFVSILSNSQVSDLIETVNLLVRNLGHQLPQDIAEKCNSLMYMTEQLYKDCLSEDDLCSCRGGLPQDFFTSFKKYVQIFEQSFSLHNMNRLKKVILEQLTSQKQENGEDISYPFVILKDGNHFKIRIFLNPKRKSSYHSILASDYVNNESAILEAGELLALSTYNLNPSLYANNKSGSFYCVTSKNNSNPQNRYLHETIMKSLFDSYYKYDVMLNDLGVDSLADCVKQKHQEADSLPNLVVLENQTSR
jgi:hypothetical protein